MKFAHPEFLYALSALAIPVLIHLFNFRRFKTVYFTNVRFLRELQEQTKRQSQLKHYLVLLSRLLAITFLVLAFAGPYRADKDLDSGSVNFVSLYLDNSFSMDGQSSEGRLLDVAKQRAIEVVESYGTADRFQILTNDFEGRHQRWLTQESVIDEIERVGLSENVRSLEQVYRRQADLRSQAAADARYQPLWLSDFQRNSSDLTTWQPDSAFPVRWVRFEPELEQNLFIDSISFDRPLRQPEQNEILRVWIEYTGEDSRADIPLRLLLNGQQKALSTFSIAPGERKEVVLNYLNGAAGNYRGEVQLEDYPITFDDRFFFQYQVREQVSVLEIHEDVYSASPLAMLFERMEFQYERTSIQAIDYARLGNFDLVILNYPKQLPTGLAGELNRFMEQGGSVALFAGTESNYLELLGNLGLGNALKDTVKLNKIEYRHPLFADVFEAQPERMDFPTVFEYRPAVIAPQAEILMEMENGLPFLYRLPKENGSLFVFVTDLQNASGNFPRHALFPTTLYNLAYLSVPEPAPYYTLVRTDMIELRGIVDPTENSDIPFHLAGQESNSIPGQRIQQGNLLLETFESVEDAGWYSLQRADSTYGYLAFNYDRTESDPTVWTDEELDIALAQWPDQARNRYSGERTQLAGVMQKDAVGHSYWKLCILLTLLFVLVEVLLLKFWKR
ncbi:MAG: BatA domain-containing protein [Flavobacteriales bacterium]|nr:BatA domain-containing protein [Flavobacteriales bacterium]